MEEEEEEDSNEDWPPSLHQPAFLMAPVQTHMLAHTHHQLVMRAEMKCLSPESPEEAELSCCGTKFGVYNRHPLIKLQTGREEDKEGGEMA